MIVNCEHCKARYDVPAASIGEGRRLRCVECGQTWWQGAGTDSEATDAETTAAVASAEGQSVIEHPATDERTDALPPLTPVADALVPEAQAPASTIDEKHPSQHVPSIAEVPAPVQVPATDRNTVATPIAETTSLLDETVGAEQTEDFVMQEVPYEEPRHRGRGLMLALAFCAACVAAVAYLLATGNPIARQVVSPVISVVSTDPVDDGRSVEISMRIANPTDLTVKVPQIAVSVDDASGREQSQRRLPAPVGTLRPNGTVEAQVSVPRVARGERMRVGFAAD